VSQVEAPAAIAATRPVRASKRTGGRTGGRATRLAPYGFVLPFVVLFLVFLVGPILIAFWRSMFQVKAASGLGFTGTPTTVFSGLKNYTQALGDADFIAGFGRVLLFGVVQVPVMLLFALLLALLFDSAAVRFKRSFQILVFLPYAVPGVIAALLWGFLYQPGVSPVVSALSSVGLHVNFLGEGTVLWSLANISIWSYTGINMIILYAALQSVPKEITEAARIDGAGELRVAWSIKLPMIRMALLLTTLSSVIGTLQLFNEPSVIRTVTSNITSAYTPNMAIYNASTESQNPNLGAAMAVLLGAVTLVLSLILLRLSRQRSGVSSS
jgi:multiple sugar transport system permease protein